jgi:Tol biopolymer transport system component
MMRLPWPGSSVVIVLVWMFAIWHGSALAQDGAVRLTYDPADDTYPDWSPDGNYLVFTSTRTGNNDLFVIPSVGGVAVQLTSASAFDSRADWSPDGSLIAFETDRSPDSSLRAYPVPDIYVIPATGGTPTRITTSPRYEERPDWFPNGTKLVFAADFPNQESLMSSPGDDPFHPANLWEIPATGGTAIQLTVHPGYENNPNYSPDGSRIAFMGDYAGNWDIWVLPSGGEPSIQLTTDPALDDHPSWSPSGEYIAFQSRRAGNGDIWIMPAAGGTPIQITTSLAADVAPPWSPDRSQIAFFSNRTGDHEIYVIDVPFAGIHSSEGTTWSRIKADFKGQKE